MTEDPADQWKSNSAARAETGERVPKIMNSNITNSGRVTDTSPFFAQSVEVSVTLLSRKHPELIVRCAPIAFAPPECGPRLLRAE